MIAPAEHEVNQLIDQIVAEGAEADELEKVKNQAEATLEFGEVEVLNRAMNLAFSKLSGDANLVNLEGEKLSNVSLDDIQRVAKNTLREENSSVLYYQAQP